MLRGRSRARSGKCFENDLFGERDTLSGIEMTPANLNSKVWHPAEWPVYTDDEIAACSNLIKIGRTFDYGRGIELERAEEVFAAFYERRFALALNSGTSALLAAYYASGIQAGDEVIVPALTFLSTATPLLLLGAVPILCDAGCQTGNVTAQTIEACIGPRTVAVAVTHVWGHPCEMDSIRALCDRRQLLLIEDCSHAHGASLACRKVGTLGEVAIFSAGGHKMISGGLGGILLTNDEDVYGRACLLANFQKRCHLSLRNNPLSEFADAGFGGNLRMSPIAAVLIRSQMDRISELIAVKHENAERMIIEISKLPGIKPAFQLPNASLGSWFGVNVIYDETETGYRLDEVLELLAAFGLKVRRPHTIPLTKTSIFSGNVPKSFPEPLAKKLQEHYGRGRTNAPNALQCWSSWIALPGNFLHERASELPEIYAENFSLVWEQLGLL
jgi:perosamine synthetase